MSNPLSGVSGPQGNSPLSPQEIKTNTPFDNPIDFDEVIIDLQENATPPPLDPRRTIPQQKMDKGHGSKTLTAAAKEFEESIETFSKALKEENFVNTGSNQIDKTRMQKPAQVTDPLFSATGVLALLNNSPILTQKKIQLEEKKETLNQTEQKFRTLEAEQEFSILEADQIVIPKETKEKEIRTLKESIEELSYDIQENATETILSAALLTPDVADYIYSAVKFFGNFQNQIPISGAIGIAGAVANTASAGYTLYKANEAATSHERHIQNLNAPQLEEAISEAPKDFATSAQEQLSKNFDDWINLLKEKYSDDFEGFKEELTKKGITLDESVNSYEEFDLQLKDNKVKAVIERQFYSIANLDTINENELTPNQRTMKGILDNRKAVLTARLAEEETWLTNLENSYENDFDAFKKRLEREGVTIDDEIQSFNDLTDELRTDLSKQHLEYKDTLTTTAKNQLRARLQAHEEINHKFFNFKLTKSGVLFGTTAIASIGAFVLSALMIAGVAFPPSLFVIPTVIGIVAAVGAIAIGLYYLHKQKPNLATTYFHLVPAQIMWNKIPILFAEVGIAFNEWRKESLDEDITALRDQFLNHSQEEMSPEEADAYRKQANEAATQIQELEDSRTYWQEMLNEYGDKVEALETRVRQARQDDFELKTGFKSFSKENPQGEFDKLEIQYKELNEKKLNLLEKPIASVTKSEEAELKSINKELKALESKMKYLRDKIEKYQKDASDEFGIISEALIKGEFWKDPEAAAMLKKYGGVKLEQELALDSSQLEENKTFLSQKLKGIILRNSGEILTWLEKQNIHEVQI